MTVKEFANRFFKKFTSPQLCDLETAVAVERAERIRRNEEKVRREFEEHDRRNGTRLGLLAGPSALR